HRDSQYEHTEITLGRELLVDVAEPSWSLDTLPVDDIPLPDHLKLPALSNDSEVFVELQESTVPLIHTWTELNLDTFS
ncbi:MAG: hypothetical protein Q8P67_14360, partial [archaeon]|nr:hypothetical protein [archaeon]